MTKTCPVCDKEMLASEYIKHVINNHPHYEILVFVLDELITLNEKH